MTKTIKTEKLQKLQEHIDALRDIYQRNERIANDPNESTERKVRAEQRIGEISADLNTTWDALFECPDHIKLTEAIEAAERGARERKISPVSVVNEIREVERVLARANLPKKLWPGTVAWVNINAQTFPHSYRFTPQATVFRARCTKAGAWTVEAIWRDRCTADRVSVELTEEAEAYIAKAAVERVRRGLV